MALSNESYIVYTDTAGEVIVPVKEAVPYLNITLIGYQHFSYHSLMSQSLTNLADDIKALQDGGLAQAEYDLDQLVADANAAIAAQILGLESGLNDKIIFLTSEAVNNTNSQLQAFDDTINGAGGIVEQTTINTTAIGDANSGLTKRVDGLETTMGDENSGIVQQFNALQTTMSEVATDSITYGEDIAFLQAEMKDPIEGMIPRVTSIEATIGGTGAGMYGDVEDLNDAVFGDGSYIGLKLIVGDGLSGLVKITNDLRTELDAEVIDSGSRLNSIELALGHLTNSGAVKDILDLQVALGVTNSDVDSVEARVLTLESYDVPAINTFLFTSSTGISDRTDTLEAEVAALSGIVTGNDDTSTAVIAAIADRVTVNEGDISDNYTEHSADITALETTIDTPTTGLSAVVGSMMQNVKDTYLTYNSQYVTAQHLIDTYNDYAAQNALSMTSRFEAYFGTTGNYVPADEVGKGYVADWVVDGTGTGFPAIANAQTESYLLSNGDRTKIDDSADAVATLNSTEGTSGSVANTANTYVTVLDNVLHNITNGEIFILNSDEAVNGSVAHTADARIAIAKTNLVNNELSVITDDITSLEIEDVDIRNVISAQADETQVEMVRYDTILPFLQKMFKYVNTAGAITDAQIDTIFGDITNSVETVAASILNPQVVLALNVPLIRFEVTLEIDRDQTFVLPSGAGADEFISIYRPSDGYSVILLTTAFQTDSRKVSLTLENKLFEDDNDFTGVSIGDILGSNADIVMRYEVQDMFGQVKQFEKLIVEV